MRTEDKGAIVAWHWRGAPDEEAAHAAVKRIAEQASEAGLEPHWGRKVLEVRPPVRVDKGGAVRELLRDVDVDAALYAGDDTTDLDAFRALTELVEAGRLKAAVRVGVRSDEGPPAIAEEADVVVDAARRRAGPARGVARRLGRALHRLPPRDRHDQRGRRNGAGGDHRARRRHAGLRPHGRVHLGRWWIAATAIGSTLGRRGETNPPIARLLAAARFQTILPELHPGRTLINRLWPLLLCTVAAGALAVIAPQVPGIACGFAIIWSLAWRRQDEAVTAIEDRDGARFYVDRTSPFKAIQLVRTPGFKADAPSRIERDQRAGLARLHPCVRPQERQLGQ